MSRPTIGKPFTQIYVERGAAKRDSPRFRRRLGAYVSQLGASARERIVERLRVETGDDVRLSAVERYYTQCLLPALLDAVTHTFNGLITDHGREHIDWRVFVERALAEENVGYEIDKWGTIHPAVDEEFQVARQATVAALGLARYTAALEAFEGAFAGLREPLDTRQAVRGVFDAIETVFRLMFPDVARLKSQAKLKPVISARGAEGNATHMMLNEMAKWVDACHNYRHMRGVEDPEPPPFDLAVWMVSTGAAHLRWLIGFDQKRQSK